jgi:phage regulator Rha-like protein
MLNVNTSTITDTVEIAELGNKTHAQILQELRETQNKIATKDYRNLWNISRYKDSLGRKCIMYNVTKKGWLLLLKYFEANTRLEMIDKCIEDENKLQTKLRTQQVMAERLWDASDRKDLYRRI